MSTLSSSTPMLFHDGLGTPFPRVFIAATTMATSAVAAAAAWLGYGDGSRGLAGIGMRLGDLLCHVGSSGAAAPSLVSWHQVTASTANVSSTTASSGYGAAYDITVSKSTI